MNFIQRAVKRRALKNYEKGLKMVEQAKRNGLMKPEVADNLIKSLKDSKEAADEK